MGAASFSVQKITPAIGAEISGIDLNDPMDTATQDALYDVLMDNLVIFFRGQDITPERHLEFARSFGTIDKPHPVYAHYPGHENIVVLANDAGNPADTNEWHTDVTFQQEPPFASILVARDVPECGGDTLWASMYAAYDGLPASMKTLLEPMSAVHDMGSFRNNFAVGETSGDKILEAMPRFGTAIHRLVQTHPMTGRKFLFVNQGFTHSLVGVEGDESRRILAYLYDRIDRPEYQIRFRWTNGTVAMWDNRCTQHYAVSDYLPAHRCMNRVTVVNDRRVDQASRLSNVS